VHTTLLLAGLLAAPGSLTDATRTSAGWYRGTVPTDRGPVRRVVRNSWEWRRGTGRAAPHASGLVALALLDAWETWGTKRHLDAARLYGLALLNDLAEVRSLTRPFAADLELLARLSLATGEPTFREGALAWAGNLPGAEAELRRTLAGRNGLRTRRLVGYDLALAIRAATALGQVRRAYALADEVWRSRGAWMTTTPRANAWDLLSRAALLEALLALDGDRYGAAVASLAATIRQGQSADGSFLGSVQTTAYALRALSRLDAPPARRAAESAYRWLGRRLDGHGAWPESDRDPRHNLEVQAEALSACLAFSNVD